MNYEKLTKRLNNFSKLLWAGASIGNILAKNQYKVLAEIRSLIANLSPLKDAANRQFVDGYRAALQDVIAAYTTTALDRENKTLAELDAEALEEASKIPPKERFQIMVRSGLINNKGQLTTAYSGDADPEESE